MMKGTIIRTAAAMIRLLCADPFFAAIAVCNSLKSVHSDRSERDHAKYEDDDVRPWDTCQREPHRAMPAPYRARKLPAPRPSTRSEPPILLLGPNRNWQRLG